MEKGEIDKAKRRYYNRNNTKRYRERCKNEIIQSENKKRNELNKQLICENLSHLVKEAPIERR
jgi:hypothetical protein